MEDTIKDLRILLACKSQEVLDTWRSYFISNPAFTMVGTARTREALLMMLEKSVPQVVLIGPCLSAPSESLSLEIREALAAVSDLFIKENVGPDVAVIFLAPNKDSAEEASQFSRAEIIVLPSIMTDQDIEDLPDIVLDVWRNVVSIPENLFAPPLEF